MFVSRYRPAAISLLKQQGTLAKKFGYARLSSSIHVSCPITVYLLKAAKKARDLQNGTVLPENWFDSDKNLGRSKNGDIRSLRRISNQQKRSIGNNMFSFFLIII